MKKDATTPSDIKFHNINNMQFQSHLAPVSPSTLRASHQILAAGASSQSATAAAARVFFDADTSQPIRVFYRNADEVLIAERGGSATSRDQDSKSRRDSRANPRTSSVAMFYLLLLILLRLVHVGLAAMVQIQERHQWPCFPFSSSFCSALCMSDMQPWCLCHS
jgi:hypothetical protein